MPDRIGWGMLTCMTRQRRESQEVWSERVERWIASGKTASAYAAELGVQAQTLRNWRWKLSRMGSSGSRRRKAHDRSAGQATDRACVEFLEVRAPIQESSAESYEVLLPGGGRIRVPASFEATALRRLIDVVESR
jgi:transposase-like protein